MRVLLPEMVSRSVARWAGGAVLAVALAGSAVAVAPTAATASTAVSAHNTKTAVVVKAARRHGFGKILVTPKGRALYVLPHGSCGASCVSIWPRLVMPRGKTMPKGAKCLATAKFGAHRRLQVTYRKMRLYTFTGDSGTSVNGNGVAGFKAAKVTVRCS
ncbi:MAG TPA: hypothetical protein VHU92_25035 [Streptosporangiaceae bacterium]|jgi:hypothetical protein|nr:hypothetical protein [Streptosporangiaceae bacterium]